MAHVLRIGGRGLLAGQMVNPVRQLSTGAASGSTRQKVLYSLVGVTGIGAAGVLYALENSLQARELLLHPPKYDWPHSGFFASLDHKSIRRGYEVYKQVCAACHSIKYVAYRHLVGVSHTEEEAKREAEEVMVWDGPNDQGEMFQRPGKLSDYFQEPYPNEEAGRAANNGASPPDLSFITLARHGREDYLFSLLTGYCDPPAGIVLQEGQSYNPYFPGGALSMGQQLFDEAIEYEDGTPATASQLAKDVSVFLKWVSENEFDWRKLMGIKTIIIFSVLIPTFWYMKRLKWSSLKSRKIVYAPKKYD